MPLSEAKVPGGGGLCFGVSSGVSPGRIYRCRPTPRMCSLQGLSTWGEKDGNIWSSSWDGLVM